MDAGRPAAPPVAPETRREVGGRVRADREEGHVAEVEQAGEADDDVEPERHHHVSGGEHHVVEHVAALVEEQRRDRGECEQARAPARGSCRCSYSIRRVGHRARAVVVAARVRVAQPARPAGRRRCRRSSRRAAPRHPIEVAQVGRAEPPDGVVQDARAGGERPFGQRVPGRLEPHQRTAPVREIRLAACQASGLEAVDDTHRARVRDAHSVGQHVDRPAVGPLRAATRARPADPRPSPSPPRSRP